MAKSSGKSRTQKTESKSSNSTGKNPSQAKSAEQTQEPDFLSRATDELERGARSFSNATERVIGVVQKYADKFVNTAPSVCISDAVGVEGEVSVAVPASGIGEVILSLGGSLRHYPARGKDGRTTFKRGTKVKIVDTANNMLFITGC